MRPLYWVILIVAQIWFACQVSFVPFNAVRASYRREQRAAALKAREENPSPATQARLQEELRLAARYVTHRQLVQAGVLLAAFLAFDIAFIYGRKHLKPKSTRT